MRVPLRFRYPVLPNQIFVEPVLSKDFRPFLVPFLACSDIQIFVVRFPPSFLLQQGVDILLSNGQQRVHPEDNRPQPGTLFNSKNSTSDPTLAAFSPGAPDSGYSVPHRLPD